MKVITSIDDAVAAVGEELGVSEWQEIDQERINAFADATGDHQWIHVDVERAKREMPGGKTIAHGYLTLSLLIPLWSEILIIDETLAVGDAKFQKRCLGRMGEVAASGRTVLFVSHNLNAIARSCLDGVQHGHFLDTERAPRRPIRDNDYLAGEVGHEDRLSIQCSANVSWSHITGFGRCRRVL